MERKLNKKSISGLFHNTPTTNRNQRNKCSFILKKGITGRQRIESKLCFRCGREGHIKRDCCVKLEEADFLCDQGYLPKWMRPVKINGSPVLGLIDRGCTKSVVHPRCEKPKDYLSWKTPYCTASSWKVHFPAAKFPLTIEMKSYDIAVGCWSISRSTC